MSARKKSIVWDIKHEKQEKVGLWRYLFVDPFLGHVVSWCINRGISPNSITVFAFLLACLSAVMYFRVSLIAGAVFYYFSFFFDCVDGEVARATKSTSRVGQILDMSCDRIGLSFVLIALLSRFTAGYEYYSASLMFVVLFMNKDIIVLLRPRDGKVIARDHGNEGYGLRRIFIGDVEVVMILVVVLPILRMFLAGVVISLVIMIGRYFVEYWLYWREDRPGQ